MARPLVFVYRQPLSQSALRRLPAPRSGSLLGVFTGSHFSIPHRGRWILRSKRRREFACPGRGGGCEQSEQTEGLKKKVASHGIVNPSVNPPYGVLPAPRPGSLLGAPYKLRHKTNTGTASRSHSLTSSRVHPPPGGFHIAQAIFHCASAQFQPA